MITLKKFDFVLAIKSSVKSEQIIAIKNIDALALSKPASAKQAAAISSFFVLFSSKKVIKNSNPIRLKLRAATSLKKLLA